MIEKEFKVVIQLDKDSKDFCALDLKEVIFDGVDNVGNHKLIDISGIVEIHKED